MEECGFNGVINWHFGNEVISWEEVKCRMRKLQNGKSEGNIYGITDEKIKNGSECDWLDLKIVKQSVYGGYNSEGLEDRSNSTLIWE